MSKYYVIDRMPGLWEIIKESNGRRVYYRAATNRRILPTPRVAAKARHANFEEIHGRAKPPEIWGGSRRTQYEEDNPKVVTVYLSRGKGVWQIDQNNEEIDWFPTHAEAIAYAQKHAHESGGEVSGA